MIKTPKQVNPLKQYVGIINSIGNHHAHGYDDKWVFGMLKHWLRCIVKIVRTNDDVLFINEELHLNAYPPIIEFCHSLPVTPENKVFKHDLMVCGLLLVVNLSETKNGDEINRQNRLESI